MVKKSGGRRRGISKGVQKYKIRLPAGATGGESAFLSLKYLELIRKAARACWVYLGMACSIIYLIPLKRRSDGSFAIGSKRRQACHFAIAVVGAVLMTHKLHVTVARMIFEDIDVKTYMCLTAFIVYFVGAAGAVGSTWTFKLMEEMIRIRSWNPNTNFLEVMAGERLTLFDSMSVCIKIIGITLATQFAALDASVLGIFFEELPTSVFYMLGSPLVEIQNGWSHRIIWHVMAYVIELASFVGPMLICAYNICAGVLGLGLLRTYVDKMRNQEIHGMNDWRKLELMYRCMRVYNKVFMNWLKYILMPVISTLCTAAVVIFYVALRPSALPFVVYMWFPLIGAVDLGILSWLWYDVVMLKRIGEDVLGTLQNRDRRYYSRMDMEEKRSFVRRGRSHRVVFVTIGEFAEITIEGLMGVWEEVFNQLLFLLTL